MVSSPEFQVPDVTFDLDSILAAAITKAQLRDFGGDDFMPPLQVLLHSLETDAQLSAVGRFGQFTRIVDLLVNRLRIEHWLQRFPQIREEQIAPPVIIVGLMRTGTTLLHRMMACDQRFYAPLWYETRYPAPLLPDYDFSAADDRIPLAKAEVQQMIAASPELAAIHPLEACAVDEELMLLEHSFYSTIPESFAHLPGYANWLQAHDNLPGYRYLCTLLQFLQWQKKRQGKNAERWLLKTPHHLHHLDIVLKVFPGATIIQTHRDPLQTIPSLCSMNYALARMGSDSVDAQVLGRHWCDKFSRSLKHSLAVRSRHASQFIDVLYTELADRPDATIQRIYNQLNFPLHDTTREAMQRWQHGNRRQDREPHHYTLEQFGFTAADLEQDFSEYRSTFLH
ncbi:MAG: sulfotransferase [Halioglobus sp.]